MATEALSNPVALSTPRPQRAYHSALRENSQILPLRPRIRHPLLPAIRLLHPPLRRSVGPPPDHAPRRVGARRHLAPRHPSPERRRQRRRRHQGEGRLRDRRPPQRRPRRPRDPEAQGPDQCAPGGRRGGPDVPAREGPQDPNERGRPGKEEEAEGQGGPGGVVVLGLDHGPDGPASLVDEAEGSAVGHGAGGEGDDVAAQGGGSVRHFAQDGNCRRVLDAVPESDIAGDAAGHEVTELPVHNGPLEVLPEQLQKCLGRARLVGGEKVTPLADVHEVVHAGRGSVRRFRQRRGRFVPRPIRDPPSPERRRGGNAAGNEVDGPPRRSPDARG
mmetsp:Transcript_10175/g.21416  ORF Transcript_10175/g.21416 Transcript_10175/m.21416 type:complete len:331 (+) Transcript_10175:162-1154(+)